MQSDERPAKTVGDFSPHRQHTVQPPHHHHTPLLPVTNSTFHLGERGLFFNASGNRISFYFKVTLYKALIRSIHGMLHLVNVVVAAAVLVVSGCFTDHNTNSWNIRSSSGPFCAFKFAPVVPKHLRHLLRYLVLNWHISRKRWKTKTSKKKGSAT